MNKNKTISQVIKSNLCTGCGTCVSLCPEEAIKLIINKKKGIYIPKLNEDRCNNCGICYKICPGHEVDFKQLNLKIFGKEPKDVLIGNYLDCYIGYATDYNIRYNSSSGGLVTQLLIFALKEGIIDGALVTRMKKDNPLEPEPFIARTKEEIIEASKSKYCPVPANIALKEILKSEEEERFAVVGLPCHIHGIRKAEIIDKKLKEKIVLHIGIFCSHTPNFLSTELFLSRLNIKKEDVIKLDYRGEGWPGSMKICLKNEDLLLLPDYWGFIGIDFFIPRRCFMCSDGVCELADISFGDAWLPEVSDDKIGRSIIIVRGEIEKNLLHMMKLKKKMELNKVNVKKVVQSQQNMLYSKKKNLNPKIKLLGGHIKYNNVLKPDISDYFFASYLCLNGYLFSKQFFRRCLGYIPLRIILLYGYMYRLFYSRRVKNIIQTRDR